MNASSTTFQMWIKDNIDSSVLSVNSAVSALDAAKLLENSSVGALVVLENQTPVGIVTNKDLAIKIIAHSYPADTPIRRIMSSPLISITPETGIESALKLMTSKKIRKLPVICGDEVLGILISPDQESFPKGK